MANQTEYSRLEQRSLMKFLVAEKCKPYEIYKRIYDVYGEACFNQINVYQWIKHGFVTMNLIQKDSPQSGNMLTFLDAAINKEGHADSVMEDKANKQIYRIIDHLEESLTIVIEEDKDLNLYY